MTYLIVLGSEPTADVTVHFSGYESSTVAPHRPATVFNTGNWNAPREVRLRTIEDADTTDETVTITHAVTSSDADYNGIAVPNLTVTIIDNDTPQVTGSVDSAREPTIDRQLERHGQSHRLQGAVESTW